MITSLYAEQHMYGKSAEFLPLILKSHLNTFANLDAKAVLKAYERFKDNRSTFPTTSEIKGILEGRIKRDATIYRELTRKRDKYEILSDKQWAYINKYEAQTLDDWE